MTVTGPAFVFACLSKSVASQGFTAMLLSKAHACDQMDAWPDQDMHQAAMHPQLTHSKFAYENKNGWPSTVTIYYASDRLVFSMSISSHGK